MADQADQADHADHLRAGSTEPQPFCGSYMWKLNGIFSDLTALLTMLSSGRGTRLFGYGDFLPLLYLETKNFSRQFNDTRSLLAAITRDYSLKWLLYPHIF